MKRCRKKIVAVGLYVPGTGFTRVLTSLFSRLKDQYEIHWLGVGYKGAILDDDGYTLYPTNLAGGDMYGAYQMATLANEIEADIIFLLNDFWMLKNYKKCIESIEHPITSIAYIPLDGKIDRPNDVIHSCFLDQVICYTNFAKDQLENAYAQLEQSKTIENFPEITVIPHGTDLSDFYPIFKNTSDKKTKRNALKRKIFPQLRKEEDSFIILNANRTSPRKALHLTIEGFAKFASNKSNVFLCLHVPNSKEKDLNELQNKIEALKLSKQIMVNPLGNTFVSNIELNELYNACDVGLNTSYGEGWGMIAFEHAATGAAQIVPNHTACGALWKKDGILINIENDLRLNNNPFMMSKINVNHLIERLEKLYIDHDFLIEKSTTCTAFAKSKIFDWNNIAKQWNLIFNKTIIEKKSLIQIT